MSVPAKKSSTVSEEKDLMFDKDMEKDTWNFKSMTDDDPMDFGFEPPAKNKKNAFKLDMGFDLDGDFGNLSSFKLDMPDFDFSSPAKKTTKKKESSDDKSSGDSKQKKNPFAFSYDFDMLDDFDLGSSPQKKGSQTTNKTMDCKEISAKRKIDKSDALDFGLNLPITRQAVSKANTDTQAKASAEEEKQNSKTTDAMVFDSSTHSNKATFESTENFEAVESPQGPNVKTSITHAMPLQPQSINTSPLKTSSYPMVEELDEPCPSNETAAPSPIRASETAHTTVDRETSPDIYEIGRSGTQEECHRDLENTNSKMITTMESSYEKTEQTSPNISSQLCSDKVEHQQDEMGTDNRAEIQDHTRRCDPDDGNCQTTLSGKISPETGPSQPSQVQDSSLKLPLDPSQSVPGLNDMKDVQGSGLIRSKNFLKPDKPQCDVLESTPIQAEIQSVTQERIGSKLNPTSDRRHDFNHALTGSRSKTSSIELVITNSGKNAANVNVSSSREKIIPKDHLNAKTVENAAGLMDQLKLQTTNTTREKSILQINKSLKLDSSMPSKHLSSGAESLQKSRLASIERPRLRNLMSDLRTVKNQRPVVVNKDQPSSSVKPEGSSSTSKETNMEAPVSKSSEIQHVVLRDKTQILHCPSSLKRKADKVANISLKRQLKRFSMSPRENRNVEKLTHRVTQGKFLCQETVTDNNTTKEFVTESPRTKSHHQVINMANLDIPITENTDNIEKAEAYTKELENICNNLKKKHEEAKELLVRAIINNNKLLMLNHPLYEDKILMVQKFATTLTLRDT